SEIKQLQLDGYRLLSTIRVNGDGPGIDAGRKISIGVDLYPHGLILIRGYTEWKSAKTCARILRNELYRLPSGRIFWSGRRTDLVQPLGMRRDFNVHVIDGEDLNRTTGVVCRICTGWGVGYLRFAVC